MVRPCAGDCSPELVLGVMSSGSSGGAFIGARGRMVAWARAAGKARPREKPGAQLPRWRWQPGGAAVVRQ
jgi:hypothetical protein